MTLTRLADAPGPRARRRARLASVVTLVVVALLLVLALRRFAAYGQLDGRRWGFFVQPSVIRFLALGLVATVRAAVVAMGIALVAGAVLALARLSRRRLLRVGALLYLETFRGLPVILLIFACYLVLPRAGLNVSPFVAVVLALSLYNSAVLGEIFRAGILSLDRGQREAALALGLREGQAMRSVILPQAVRRMVPAIVSQLVTLLKDTSLGFVASYEELLRRASQAGKSATPASDLQAFLIVGAVYVLVNLALGRLARRLEVAQRRRYRAGAIDVTGAEDVSLLAVEGD